MSIQITPREKDPVYVMKKFSLFALAAASLLWSFSTASAEKILPGFKREVLFNIQDFLHPDPAPGNENRPPSVVTIETFPDGRIFFGTGDSRGFFWDPVGDVDGGGDPVMPPHFFDYRGRSTGEMGVTGAVPAPDYATTGHFFVSYVFWPHPWETHTTRRMHIRRFTADLTDLSAIVPGEDVLIFDIPDDWATDFHFGGNIEIGPDEKLYYSTGDDANVGTPQNLNSFRGKVLRMNLDGSPAPDNPFYQDDSLLPRNYIYSLGLRNPFRLLYDEEHDIFFCTDTGQSLWEELNVISPGSNHGWVAIEGPLSDNVGVTPPPNYSDPYYAYQHGQQPLEGQAIVGVVKVPPHTMFPQEYVGDLLISDWGNWFDRSPGEIYRLHRDENGALVKVSGIYEMSVQTTGLADLAFAPDGSLLVAQTGAFFGQVHRFTYQEPDNPPEVTILADVTEGLAPLTVQFDSLIVDEGTPALTWDFGDGSPAFTRPYPAHVFDAPGVYTVTLSAKDEFNSITTESVQVLAYQVATDLSIDGRVLNVSNGTGELTSATLTLLQSDARTPVEDLAGAPIVVSAPTGIFDLDFTGLQIAGNFVVIRAEAENLLTRDVFVPLDEQLTTDIHLANTAIVAQALFSADGSPVPDLDLWISSDEPGGGSFPYLVTGGRDFSAPLTPAGYPSGLLTRGTGEAYFPIREEDIGLSFQIGGNLEGRVPEHNSQVARINVDAMGRYDATVLLQFVTGGEGCDELVPPSWYNVDFSVVEEIFTTHCIGCHAHVQPYMDLDLTPGFAYNSIVQRRSKEVPTLFLIEQRPVGNAASEDQYLLEKINCLNPSVGTTMPPFGLISGKERRDVAQWIRNGAQPSANPARRTNIWASTEEAGSPARVQFRAGADAANPPFSYAWEFGDGSTSEEIYPIKTYVTFDEPTTYTATLAIRDNTNALVGTETWTVVVKPVETPPGNQLPVADFQFTDELVHLFTPTLVDASASFDPDGAILAYSWDFNNDGTVDLTTDSPVATWTPERTGNATVALIITDNQNGQTRLELVKTVEGVREDAWLIF